MALKGAVSVITSVKGALVSLAATAGGIYALHRTVQSFINEVDKFQKLSIRLNETTSFLSEMAYAAEVRERSGRGAASGLYQSASGLGSILGSSTGGALAEFTSLETMILTYAAVVAGAAAYLWRLARLHRHRGT